MTLWKGRFTDRPAQELLAFTVSLSFDQRLAADDVVASRAHVRGLERAGVLTHQEVGILIATNGITGQARGRHAAALGIGAAARGIKVLVITKEDLVALTSTEDFIEMVSRRYLRAVASGTIGLP